ncbi:MAG: hypothetical protein PHW10_04735 [Candidatus Peribacteraceae bacterium]|nr:hypothetical protein [Candidatus Peribacteraceae bacterium]
MQPAEFRHSPELDALLRATQDPSTVSSLQRQEQTINARRQLMHGKADACFYHNGHPRRTMHPPS